MIEHDDADDLARTLVDELMSAVQQTIYDKHIERQLVPYTVHGCMKRAIDIVDVCTLRFNYLYFSFQYNYSYNYFNPGRSGTCTSVRPHPNWEGKRISVGKEHRIG